MTREEELAKDYNERKLKEERDRYEAQNQEAYDKEVSGENFLRDRAKENEEDEPDAGDIAKGVSFEIAAGLATDKLTAGLLNPLFGPTGIALYGLANFASGAVANAIAQRLRGDTSFSLGEVLSSGAVGIIPGTQLKAGKAFQGVKTGLGRAGSLKRAAVVGGLTGVSAEQIRVGIDEGRFLTAQEALLGGAVGGAVSTGMQALFKAGPAGFRTFNQYLYDNPGSRLWGPASKLNLIAPELQGTVGAQRTPPLQPQSNINPPATQISSPYYNWGIFGYKSPSRTLPTQVRKVLGTDLQDEVALSLWNQYNRANEYIKSTGSLKGFGEKFVNPANGKLYYIQRTRGKNPRLTLQSVEKKLETVRRRREKDVASMPVQELLKKFKTKDIEALNKVESAKFKEATDPIIRKIQLNSKEIHKYNQYPDIQESIAAQIAEDGRKLDAILEGYYYGEHGHAIRSKVWDHVKRIKRFANQKLMFKAGDGKNFHIVFEPNKRNQQFKKLKDDFELIIESTIGAEQKRYPDVIVNYNPVLSGPGKKIRFEKLSTLKVGFKSRQGKRYPDMMYGDLIAEYDVDKLGIPTPAKMQKWLDENLPGEKLTGGKGGPIPEGFKKTIKSTPKVEDLKLKQSTKKKYVKKPKK